MAKSKTKKSEVFTKTKRKYTKKTKPVAGANTEPVVVEAAPVAEPVAEKPVFKDTYPTPETAVPPAEEKKATRRGFWELFTSFWR